MTSLLRQTALGRLARRVRWTLFGNPELSAALGRLSVRSAPRIMETDTAANWVLRVENHSRRIWDAAALRHQWLNRSGTAYSEVVSVPLPKSLLPGDWADVAIPVTGPAAVGDFRLVWSLTEPAIAGEAVSVPVTFPLATDIDYHRVYASADLNANS